MQISRPQRPMLSGVISPTSGILWVAPTIEAHHIPQCPVPTTMAAGGVADVDASSLINGIDLSPSSESVSDAFARDRSSSWTPKSLDGVPRCSMGIPMQTPGTVTLFRGSGELPRRSDGLAADLFRSFDTPSIDSPRVVMASSPPATTTTIIESSSAHTEVEQGDAGGGFTFDVVPLRAVEGCSARMSSESPTIVPGNSSHIAKDASPSVFCTRSPVWMSIRSGTPTPPVSLGKAQRVPSASPASVSREVRGLMDALDLRSTPEKATSNGVELFPARASVKQQRETGSRVVVTQVRRSPRLVKTQAPGGGESDHELVKNLLQASDYSYGEENGHMAIFCDRPQENS